MEKEKWRWLLSLAGVSILVWFLLKYVVILILPLIFAFILTRLVYPLAIRLKKAGRLPSKVCRMMVFFAYLFVIGSFFLGVFIIAIKQIQRLLENIGTYKIRLQSFVYESCRYCDGLLGFSSGETYQKIQSFLMEGSGNIWKEKLSKLPVSAVSVFGVAGRIGLVVLFSIFLTVMALMNLERWYHAYRHCGFYKECHELLRELTGAGYAYVRTQAVIIFCISILCTVTLFFMGNPYALLVGVGIAFVDALPVLGSGTVFLPWILISAVSGRFWQAGILVLLYAGCQLVRQFLEPRLMGQKLQIEPAVILASMFAGLKLFSIAGVILGPVGFLLIRAIMRLLATKEKKCYDI